MRNKKSIRIIQSVCVVLALLTSRGLQAEVPAFDSDKPQHTFITSYAQTFSGAWDATIFYGQWEAMIPGMFNAADIASGYLQYVWPEKRILYSKLNYSAPYTFTVDLDYASGSSRAGVVIRAVATNIVNSEYLQAPVSDPGFNREGIAFYPTEDGLAMNIQFSGVENGSLTPVKRFTVPKPAGVTSLRNRGVLSIEDFGTTIYVYYNGARFVRINLSGKTGSIYTSGVVYNSDMQSVGSFEGMEVLETGKVSVCQRDAALRLYSAEIKVPQVVAADFDSGKPQINYTSEYYQEFNPSAGWNQEKFYAQWNAQEPGVFTEEDISSGYLQFVWMKKRIIYSKGVYVAPYKMQVETDYADGSSRGGVVIRAFSSNLYDVEYLQEPPFDPGFNREGIAFYPSENGLSMNVQFSGTEKGRTTTSVTTIAVPKPQGITSFRTKGILRVEDFDTTIYVYYNDLPLSKIVLEGKTGQKYTSGKVYNAAMQQVGVFSGMEIETIGKVAVAQRDAALRLYNVRINYRELQSQKIQFAAVGSKMTTDPAFEVSATASSGLPVVFRLVSGPATLNNNIITLNGTPGLVTIAANQSGNSEFYPAPEAKHTFYVRNPLADNVSSTSQQYVDNWVATDALGRTLPTFDLAGPKKQNRKVGVFYYVWNGYQGDKVYDITKILKAHPLDPLGSSNPLWGSYGVFHFWGEPENGYYRSEDPWVIRRDLHMLSNAQVDFIYIDATNAYTYLETVKVLCQLSMQMRSEGINTPEIVFTTATKSGHTMNALYDEFYSNSLFDSLWFRWQNKPLILGNINDPELRPEVKDFFTIKYSWAWTDTATEPNHWQWVDTYPQDYGWSTDPSIPEQIVVSVAQHPDSDTGSSYSKGASPAVNEDYLTEFTGRGFHFDEQWSRALQVDPSVVMVTQWNEWIAQRFIWNKGDSRYAGRPIKDGDTYFIDAFSQEFNRDMAPMKGGHTDNYYYQLISNIRKYKGMAAPQEFSTPATIAIDGNFGEWYSVLPLFRDPIGDTMHRNYIGYDSTVVYTNSTGRNDIVESRATYDTSNLYFYVKTAGVLSSYNDPNWMLLFIDADRMKGTGWEGYDYVVNSRVVSSTLTTIKKWDGTAWTNEITVPYRVVGNEMELCFPRELLMQGNHAPEFYFHWADNPQHLNDISSFFTDGESAPDRRFNYNFSTSNVENKQQTPYKPSEIPGVVEFEDFDNGGAGIAYVDATFDNSGGHYRTNEAVDIEQKDASGFNVTSVYSNEWVEYTVNVKIIGTVTATIHYAAAGSENEATLFVNDKPISEIIRFPSSGGLATWATQQVDLQLTAGQHQLKFFINKASGDFKLDKIVFTEKSVVYPGTGTGLSKSIWKATAGGRVWFNDSICSGIDPVIDFSWGDTSPGCEVSNDFWNMRWRGFIQPLYSETYTFYLTVNDMGRVWINNQLVVDGWYASSSGQTITGTVELVAGQRFPVRVDFAEKAGDARVKLEWSSESTPREVVPQRQLYPVGSESGLSEVDVVSVQVYPNPARDNIQINTGVHEVNKVSIVDLQGRTVFVLNEPFAGEKQLHLTLEKGVYFIKLSGAIPFKSQKLIIE